VWFSMAIDKVPDAAAARRQISGGRLSTNQRSANKTGNHYDQLSVIFQCVGSSCTRHFASMTKLSGRRQSFRLIRRHGKVYEYSNVVLKRVIE